MIATLLTLVLAQDMTAKPVKEHEVLKKFEGEWDSTMKATMEPGKDPMVSKGKESCKLIMGGLFLVTSLDAEMMGGKFFGHGILGYDVQKKKYTGSWVDSMAIPKGGFFPDKVEQGRFGPVFPKTPAGYGFSIVAKVIPGHGKLGTVADLKNFHAMLVETTGLLKQAIADGKSLADLKAAGLPEKFKEFGTGFIKTDRWIETIYNSAIKK